MKTTHKEEPWFKLDSIAKVFPSNSTKQDTKVFRFACELKEDVNPKILQQALDENTNLFPLYRSTLKRGAFWYYLEETNIAPVIKEEKEPICSRLYNKDSPSLLFRITYFKKRINLEIHHVLSDGTGALEFLKGLVCQYLIIKEKKNLKKMPSFDYDASLFQKTDDSFQKYYNNKATKTYKRKRKAYQISGAIYSEYRIRVIEGSVSVKEMLELAHKYNTTLTILTTAIYMQAIEQEMSIRDKKNPIVISIPVNLRKYFKSNSLRNFFGVFDIGYHFNKGDAKLESIIDHIKGQFEDELKESELSNMINSYSSLEHNFVVRTIPLFIKDIIIKVASFFSSKNSTSCLSNIGKISLPKELIPFVNSFDVFMSTGKKQVCMCSFEDNMTISFTTTIVNSNVEKNFFRILTSLGISVEIATNMWEEKN